MVWDSLVLKTFMCQFHRTYHVLTTKRNISPCKNSNQVLLERIQIRETVLRWAWLKVSQTDSYK
jgi:hypothetical protein